MKRMVLLAIAALVVGAAAGAGVTYALEHDADSVAEKARILCPTDASAIASAYEEQALDLNLKVDCQQATGGSESPLEGATLAPEYRCWIRVQLASSPYQLDCEPLP